MPVIPNKGDSMATPHLLAVFSGLARSTARGTPAAVGAAMTIAS